MGCTGHRTLPSAIRREVATGIWQEVERQRSRSGILVGVCSLAVGADQLFAHAVLAANGALHVVVPCRHYEQTFAFDEIPTFHSLRDQAASVELLDHADPGAKAFFEAGRRVVDGCDLLLTAWDGREPDGSGGTADVVEYAASKGVRIINVWPRDE